MHKNVKRVLLVSVMMLLLLLGTQTALAQSPEGEGAWGGRLFGRLRARFAGTIDAIAEALGLSAKELTEQLGAGASLADLAEEQGVALTDLRGVSEEARIEAQRERIEQAVADGDLSRAQADWLLEGIENGYAFYSRGRFSMMRGDPGAVQEAMADVLGLSADELELQLWAGEALADLADEANVELEAVLEAGRAARQEAVRERIDEAEANGAINAEEAEWLRRGLEQGYLDDGFGMVGRFRFMGPDRGSGRGGMPFGHGFCGGKALPRPDAEE